MVALKNRGLLTSQALLVSQASLGRQQAFVAPCANAAVIRMLPGCQNWIPHLRAVDFCHVHKSTQSIAAYACSALASLELGDLLLPLLCCKVPVHLSSTCGALRPLSAAVNSNTERCAGRLVALCRTSTHGDVCAYSDAFLSRGTRLNGTYERYCTTAAVKSLLTVRVLLQQKPESECCA